MVAQEPEAVPTPPPQVEKADDVVDHPSPWRVLVSSTVRIIDIEGTFQRLEKSLELGDSVGEYGAVVNALDKSANNLYDAARLARAAKIEDEAFGLELDKQMEVLRSAARAELDAEKAEGKRSKAPTIQDVEDRILAKWPDRVATMKRRRAEMHGMMRSLEALENAWQARCAALKSLVDRFRTTG